MGQFSPHFAPLLYLASPFPVTSTHAKLSIFMLTGLFLGIWVKWWAEANELHPNEKIGFYLGVYAALGVLAIISLILACWYFN